MFICIDLGCFQCGSGKLLFVMCSSRLITGESAKNRILWVVSPQWDIFINIPSQQNLMGQCRGGGRKSLWAGGWGQMRRNGVFLTFHGYCTHLHICHKTCTTSSQLKYREGGSLQDPSLTESLLTVDSYQQRGRKNSSEWEFGQW